MRREHSFHGPLNHVLLPLPSRHHSTAAPSPEHYGKRYELGCCANFLELRVCELPRTLLPRTPVNKAAFSEERRPRRNRPVASSFAALLLVRRVHAAEEGAYLLLDPALLARHDVPSSL